eukprot:TRINITY_DN912_c0_g2_i1.p1 TRINITY_DN912_c0_g2~~TRINITY_DN912_c0_g2_i1.p1  ORF type:complete len:363 (-),score=24.34 TRINITY_DN912_c0_g2_i1:93-1181(-)
MRSGLLAVVVLVLGVFGAVGAYEESLWGVGSCVTHVPSPLSVSKIDSLSDGNYHIIFNSSVAQYPRLLALSPERIAVDEAHKLLYSTAFKFYLHENRYIPSQVLVKLDLITKHVTVIQDQFPPHSANITIIAHLEFDTTYQRLYATRYIHTYQDKSFRVFLDVINPVTGTFKSLWHADGVMSLMGALNEKKNLFTFPIFNPYQPTNSENGEIITFDLNAGKVANQVKIDTTAINPSQPHNISYVSNMHFDPASNQIILIGNLPSADLEKNDTIWGGTLDTQTGKVQKLWSGEFRTLTGDPLVMYLGSAFDPIDGLLTLKMIDARSDRRTAVLLTLNTRTWLLEGRVPFHITDNNCILNIAYA